VKCASVNLISVFCVIHGAECLVEFTDSELLYFSSCYDTIMTHNAAVMWLVVPSVL